MTTINLIDTATIVETPAMDAASRRIAANTVAEKLLAAEAAIDAAIAAVAGLTAAMPQAAIDGNVGIHVGHEALMHAMESCQSLVKARTNMIRTHKALVTAQADIGLAEVALMDVSKCRDLRESAEVRHLSAVA